jgi:hypothetical protein
MDEIAKNCVISKVTGLAVAPLGHGLKRLMGRGEILKIQIGDLKGTI